MQEITSGQEKYIHEYYLSIPIKTLSRKLGIGHTRLRTYMRRNNLVVPAKIIERRKLDSRLKKGNVPYTKGKKQHEFMSPEAIIRTKKTRFKKGHTPHNTKHNGAIVVRKMSDGNEYKWIRISLNNWKMLHRYLWEQENGPVPNDHIVKFKDGDTLNATLSNLELRSKIEHAIRNNPSDYPEEIIPSMVLLRKLELQLKKRQHA